MDVLRVKSGFLKGIISKIVSSAVKKKLGGDVSMKIGDLDLSIDDAFANLHLEIDVKMPKDTLRKLIFEKVMMGGE